MSDAPKPPHQHAVDRDWRSPTISEIAKESRVGTATVDRVLNGRGNVREATRKKVWSALDKLRLPATSSASRAAKRIAFLSDSGASFNLTLEAAVQDFCTRNQGISCPFTAIPSSRVDPIKFANLIERCAEESEGLVIVAREDLMINRAIRNVMTRKVPVICLTTDLPSSGRLAYVGSDQTSAGSTAAYLMGQLLPRRDCKILLVYSAPYRAQEERELGIRRVLRSDFNHIDIDDRVNSNDDSESSYKNLMNYIEANGAPAGIYNTVGGNSGIGKALTEQGLAGKTIFIGHELNENSRRLLETGVMNFAIGHDVMVEVETAIRHIIAFLAQAKPAVPELTRVRVYTKYNCN
jgi:LacI family transcriptional regulator